MSWNLFTFGRQNEADIQMYSRQSLCRFKSRWIPGLDILLVSKMIHLLDPLLALPYRQLCLARGNKYREPLLGNWQEIFIGHAQKMFSFSLLHLGGFVFVVVSFSVISDFSIRPSSGSQQVSSKRESDLILPDLGR